MAEVERVRVIFREFEKEIRKETTRLTSDKLKEIATFLTAFVEAYKGFYTMISDKNRSQIEINPTLLEAYKLRFNLIGDHFYANLFTLKDLDEEKFLEKLKKGENYAMAEFFKIENVLEQVKVIPDYKLDYFQLRIHEEDAKKLKLNEILNKILIRPITKIEKEGERKVEVPKLQVPKSLNNLPLSNSNMSIEAPKSRSKVIIYLKGLGRALNAIFRELSLPDEAERKIIAGYHISQIPGYEAEGRALIREGIEMIGEQDKRKAWFKAYVYGMEGLANKYLKEYYKEKYGLSD